MPTHRVTQEPVCLRVYDAIGQDSERIPEFIRHVGLSTEQREQLRCREAISMVHMAPPLQIETAPDCAHVVGSVPLTSDEIQQMSVFIDELRSEFEANDAREIHQYVIRPHVLPKRDSDGTTIYMRFNCAGFVIEAYRAAGIDLLHTFDDDIPMCSLQDLLLAYPDVSDHLQNAAFRQREQINLPGEGPWPVVLPGYVLNALAREEEVLRTEGPYHAVPGDEYYPSHR